MAHYNSHLLLALLSLLSLTAASSAASPVVTARQLYLVAPTPITLDYHNGDLLTGNYSVNLLWYGRFTSSQRAIISDFISSLSSPPTNAPPKPSVADWWATTSYYHTGAAKLHLGRQLVDAGYSLGRTLTDADLVRLSARLAPHRNSVAVVLTSSDVIVDGFCMSRCGVHGSAPAGGRRGKARFAYVWVGDSSSQCAGQCAWPFHQPEYGPQAPPLVAPNGDVGVDGMVINLATLLAGAVTNPFGRGYFQGPETAPLEAVSACTGIFGSGAYSGYPGSVLADATTGASYNAVGADGREFLLPAMWDPKTSQCSTLV